MRKESEKAAAAHGTSQRPVDLANHPQPDLKACFVSNEYGARYDTHCMHGVADIVDLEAVAGDGPVGGNGEL